ncbi:MAG: hypothetical protein JO166_08460 [Deltaproteobacteria bacterium]|nr:hypothetical protein [Deltaproteobacteria bacterium]
MADKQSWTEERRLASQFANPNLPGRSTVDHDPTSDAEVQELKQRLYASYPDWQKQGQIVTGSPKTFGQKTALHIRGATTGHFLFLAGRTGAAQGSAHMR